MKSVVRTDLVEKVTCEGNEGVGRMPAGGRWENCRQKKQLQKRPVGRSGPDTFRVTALREGGLEGRGLGANHSCRCE